MGWLPYFNCPVDPNDRTIVAQLREKVIPWSETPFDDSKEDITTTACEPEEEFSSVSAVPPWLELFFDLAWTTTFSGLTANTPVTEPLTVASYVVFFVLAWWLWVSQVLYDTSFFNNDWFHRIMLLCQFCLFGALAAFTEGFDISQGLSGVSTVNDDAATHVDDEYIRRAFLAIAIVFSISRLLLALQYVRVMRFARHRRIWNLILHTGALLVSAFLFFTSFLVVKANPDSVIAQYAKFVLWAVAVVLELGMYLYTSPPGGLVRQGSMPERLAGLTTVVLGEGLNGLIDPLVSAAKSVGFDFKTGLQVLVTAIMVFVIFILYFDSFRTRLAPTPLRQKMVVLVHFPAQLAIILLLEGMKCVLDVTTLTTSTTFFLGRLNNDNVDFDHVFRSIGLNFTQETDNFGRISNTNEETVMRVFGQAFETLFTQFNVLDDATQKSFDNYINTPFTGSLASSDGIFFASGQLESNPNIDLAPGIDMLVENVLAKQIAPVTWIAGVAGAFLICLAILMALNGLPRHQFAFWSLMSRVVTGTGLIMLSWLDLSPVAIDNWITTGWFLPTIVLFYILQFFLDYVIALVVARKIHLNTRDAIVAEQKMSNLA